MATGVLAQAPRNVVAGRIEARKVAPAAQPAAQPAPKAKRKSKRKAQPSVKPAPAKAKTVSAPTIKKNKKKRAQKKLALKKPEMLRAAFDEAELERRWQDIRQTLRPTALVALGEAFATDFPGSRYEPELKSILAGAQHALAAQRAARLSSDALEETEGDEGHRRELGLALRGDKDAAQRIAQMYRDGTNGLSPNDRRAEQWLYFAAELGSGAASWQLAEILNLAGQWAEAAKYERKSVELGFRPPARLPTRGLNF